MSNPDVGECCFCGERNLYTVIICKRCENVLPWGMLVLPESYKPKPAPAEGWLVRNLDRLFNSQGKGPGCRYCLEPIAAEALVCPHCRKLLALGLRVNRQSMSFGGEGYATDRIHHASPELRAIIDDYLKDHPDGVK